MALTPKRKRRTQITVRAQQVPQFQYKFLGEAHWTDAPYSIFTFHELRAYLRGKGVSCAYGRRIEAYSETLGVL